MKQGRLLVTIIFIVLCATTLTGCPQCDRSYLQEYEDRDPACYDIDGVFIHLCESTDGNTQDKHYTCCNNQSCFQVQVPAEE
jgi:hypothetical protein